MSKYSIVPYLTRVRITDKYTIIEEVPYIFLYCKGAESASIITDDNKFFNIGVTH